MLEYLSRRFVVMWTLTFAKPLPSQIQDRQWPWHIMMSRMATAVNHLLYCPPSRGRAYDDR
jgi:hypothetical protein